LTIFFQQMGNFNYYLSLLTINRMIVDIKLHRKTFRKIYSVKFSQKIREQWENNNSDRSFLLILEKEKSCVDIGGAWASLFLFA